MKKQKKYKCSIFIPAPLYKKLDRALQFSLVSIKSRLQRESFSNAFWAVSSFLINKCCYENDDIAFFVNVHKNKFIEMTGQNTSVIKKIKDWLIRCGIFECNFNHCNSGANKFSYGYRIHESNYDFFSSKSLTSIEMVQISFNINEVFLNNEFGLDSSLLDKLDKLMLLKDGILADTLYIKRDNDSAKIDDYQDLNAREYEDRTDMNQYEKLISERLKKITVDIKKLSTYKENDFKKLYWIGRLVKSKSDEEVKFSHGRLYRNPFWHCLPKEFRNCCLYDKENYIVEGFDVKNCFATLLLKVIEGHVSNQEYQKYKRIVRTGIYEDIAEMTTKFDRNDMKQPFCHWLFSNNKTKKLAINERFTVVRNYFQTEFPEIYNFVTNYAEIETEEKGKKVKKSRLSVDCQWIENELVLNTLCKWTEEKFNVEVWTLHDAICCKEDDFTKVDWSEVKEMWYNIMNLK